MSQRLDEVTGHQLTPADDTMDRGRVQDAWCCGCCESVSSVEMGLTGSAPAPAFLGHTQALPRATSTGGVLVDPCGRLDRAPWFLFLQCPRWTRSAAPGLVEGAPARVWAPVPVVWSLCPWDGRSGEGIGSLTPRWSLNRPQTSGSEDRVRGPRGLCGMKTKPDPEQVMRWGLRVGSRLTVSDMMGNMKTRRTTSSPRYR